MKEKIIWAIIIIVLVAAVFFGDDILPQKSYQAVFLTNGQVYFGKLSKENSNYPVLEDIYYLQDQSSNINIVKLGAELHGPEDEMKINREQILFIEDLRSDSKVLEAIKQFKPRSIDS